MIWKFNLPIADSFMNNPVIREKLQLIVDGKGSIPLDLSSGYSKSKMIEVIVDR